MKTIELKLVEVNLVKGQESKFIRDRDKNELLTFPIPVIVNKVLGKNVDFRLVGVEDDKIYFASNYSEESEEFLPTQVILDIIASGKNTITKTIFDKNKTFFETNGTKDEFYGETFTCSVCNYDRIFLEAKFCPNCGRKSVGENRMFE